MEGEICKECGSTPCNPNCTKAVDSNNGLLLCKLGCKDQPYIGGDFGMWSVTCGNLNCCNQVVDNTIAGVKTKWNTENQ